MVRILVKILGCNGINGFSLISIYGIENNTVCLRFTYILISDGDGTGGNIVCDTLILENIAFQLILEAVGTIELAGGEAFGKTEHGISNFGQFFSA